MTIHCAICQHRLRTRLAGNDGQRSLVEMMNAHMKTHPAESAELKQMLEVAARLMATYILFREYIDIPDEETELIALYEKNEETMASLFGFEPEDEGPALVDGSPDSVAEDQALADQGLEDYAQQLSKEDAEREQ